MTFRRLRHLGRCQRVNGQACRTGQNRGPEPLGLRQLKEGQAHGRLPAVGHIKFQLRQAKGPRQQGLDHINSLHPVNAGSTLLTEHHTGVDVHVIIGDLVAGKTPG